MPDALSELTAKTGAYSGGMRFRWLVRGAALVAGIGLGVGIAAARQSPSDETSGIATIPRQATAPPVDKGAALNVVAPAFTLTDQFGKTVSLTSMRGKAVVLSFNDPVCTTICPLTTTGLLEAKKLLGPAAKDVQFIGISANPEKTGVKWVRQYSVAHGMLHKWRFLTGSLPQLKRVWSAYGVGVSVIAGDVVHNAATFVIDPQGRERRLFLTAQSYSNVPQFGVALARGISAVLPAHPPVESTISLAPVKLLGPDQHFTLPQFGGGNVRFAANPRGRLQFFFFFNSWDTTAPQLEKLSHDADRSSGLPLLAINEADVETSANSLRVLLSRSFGPAFLMGRGPIDAVIAIDADGRVADGYGVNDSPWLMLMSGSGKILWTRNIAEDGWPSLHALVRHVHAALR
jgi:cytochrome oxidase Cu insertion factor (SCO1/SenC/PrrC family)